MPIERTRQAFLTYKDIRQANPDWTDRMVEDYIAIKADIGTLSVDTEQIEVNRVGILQNAVNIAKNTVNIALNALGIAQNAEDILGRMRWAGIWIEATYLLNDVVQDTGWLMVANKETTDRAAPQPNGFSDFLLSDTQPFSLESDLSLVRSGHQYDFTKGGILSSMRVWVPALGADINYRIVLANITDPSNITSWYVVNPFLLANEWTVVGVNTVFVTPGDTYIAYLEADNSAAETVVSSDWFYGGVDNSAAPDPGTWNRRTQNDIVRVSKTDGVGADQTALLLSITSGSNLGFLAVDGDYYQYNVSENPTDEGLYIEYQVTLNETVGGVDVGETTQLIGVIPTPQLTEYEEDAGYWTGNQPDYATLTGLLQFDGVSQVAATNAYGVDLQFQEFAASPDWDYMALSDLSVSAPEILIPLPFKVTNVTSDYQVLMSDDAVVNNGDNTITLPAIEYAIKPVTITSQTGTVTVASDSTVQGSTSITAGTAARWYPASQWWRE